MKKIYIMILSLILFSFFPLSLTGEDRLEIPYCYDAEIVSLNPYPVTTQSTRRKKIIILSDAYANALTDALVWVQDETGDIGSYVTDDNGTVHVNSIKTIRKIILMEWNNTGEDVKISDYMEEFEENMLCVQVVISRTPEAIDLNYLPADLYLIALNYED